MSNAFSLRVPAYGRHKPTGQARVQIDGRTIYLGKYGSQESREAYHRITKEWVRNGGTLPHSTDITTVGEAMVAYLRFAKGYYRKNGKVTREYEAIRGCCRIINPLYGRSPAAEFGPLRLKTVRQEMIRAGHSRKYVNKNVGRIVRMFKWAAAEELLPASVPQALSMVAGLRQGRTEAPECPPVPPVDDAIVEATLEHLPALVADMVRLQRLTGMRPSELCILRPCDLDRSGTIWIYRPESHKTEHHGRDRLVLIGPRSQAVLLRYLARDSQCYCFRPVDSEAKRRAQAQIDRQTPLTCGNLPGTNRVSNPKKKAGERYTTGSFRRAIHRACDKAFPHPQLGSKVWAEMSDSQIDEVKKWQSFQRWSPNQLRHSAATEVRREFGLEAAQIILGHSQANVTEVYAERDLAVGLRVAAKIG
ncbi:tyrosine-type recombinase/integrase [Bythopirellula polymerisocia]|uniref:Site-specific tyrosine recombinase XerC n=1 Tax=Bythopirellula polymerisocia TaxID=2528003 RepID=A0A5C6CHK0_9BACT|nr:tyrosine-type recombinase/integrase [Bythopirellula polymerisocia]TWU23838.1 site-specific tyrosine recombinase XerC [Bythopirellula polymerisocia]